MAVKRLLIKNGIVLTPLNELATDLYIEDGRIQQIGNAPVPRQDASDLEVFDADGGYVCPGLIDLQVNGGPMCDLWQEIDAAKLDALRLDLAQHGVTSFLPTLITGPVDHVKANLDLLKDLGVRRGGMHIEPEFGRLGQTGLARMPGVHLEGPYISPKRPGVHPAANILPLDQGEIGKIIDAANEKSVALMTVAPETAANGETISVLQKMGIKLSAGHSNASSQEARAAFDAGIGLVTHLFNAMPPLHHRQVGIAGAALLDDRVVCQLIADGLHLSPEMVALIYKIKGPDSTILVTDRAAIGTSQGGLVGASITLDQAVANVVKWGVCTFATAIKMASYNPAVALGLNDVGFLAPGCLGDIAIFDSTSLLVKQVFVGGIKVQK